MTLLARTAGDTALIILAAFWGALVLFLCLVLVNTFRVLESTKMTIDAMREETVPLLREVKTSIEKTNREIDRVDIVSESAGRIVGRVERLSGLIEEAATSPIVKLIALGAGVKKAARAPPRSGRRDATAPGAPEPDVRRPSGSLWASVPAPPAPILASRWTRRQAQRQAGGDRAGGARRAARSLEARRRVGRGGQARHGRARTRAPREARRARSEPAPTSRPAA